MKKILALTLVLAVGVVVTGCTAESKSTPGTKAPTTPATPSKM